MIEEIRDVLIPLLVIAPFLFVVFTFFTNRLVRSPDLSRRQQLFAKIFFALLNVPVAVVPPLVFLVLLHDAFTRTPVNCLGCHGRFETSPIYLSPGEIILLVVVFIVLPLILTASIVYAMGSTVSSAKHLSRRMKLVGYVYSFMLGATLSYLALIFLGPKLQMMLRPIFFPTDPYLF